MNWILTEKNQLYSPIPGALVRVFQDDIRCWESEDAEMTLYTQGEGKPLASDIFDGIARDLRRGSSFIDIPYIISEWEDKKAAKP